MDREPMRCEADPAGECEHPTCPRRRHRLDYCPWQTRWNEWNQRQKEKANEQRATEAE